MNLPNLSSCPNVVDDDDDDDGGDDDNNINDVDIVICEQDSESFM